MLCALERLASSDQFHEDALADVLRIVSGFQIGEAEAQNQVRVRGYEAPRFGFGVDVRGTVSWCGGACVALFVHAHGALLRFRSVSFATVLAYNTNERCVS